MALAWWILACAVACARAQSNYDSHANDIEYQGEGLPEQTVLDGKVRRIIIFSKNADLITKQK